ncbi:MAG: hypothetical protein GXO80_03860 [Chlorobi bacterium]|nr:hypothetical protein [Chlorobiota bacterium]
MSMPIKHEFGKIGDTLVSFVEKGVTEDRMKFLTELLKFNGFEVITEEETPAEGSTDKTFAVTVTDMVFNAVIWIYDRKMKTPDGKIVNEDYWMQRNTDLKPQYWER